MKQSSLVRGLYFVMIVLALAVACAPAPTPVPTAAPPTAAPKATVAPTSAPTKPPTSAPTTAAVASPTATSIRAAVGSTSGCHLILSTTTSTYDSGLLGFILPAFEKKFNCKVDVVAVGTGQAIAIGQKGDADALLVHDRKAEDKFVADGYAKERLDVMYNDFIVVGPKSDPAKAGGSKYAKDAFKAIMDAKATFASRGDKSGTNTKELSIWSSLNITPTKDLPWYNALGQGMGETLLFSNEKPAYTLTDRGTWLATKDKLPNLVVITGGNNIKENGDKDLLNPYGVMAVSPDKHPGVNYEMATNFVKWITSVDEQKVINSYGADKYGQQLFYASSKEFLQSQQSQTSSTPTAASSTSAPSANAALTITGAVLKPQSLTLDALKGMLVVTITAQHPKLGNQSYQGVRLNALLDQAQPKPEATKLTLTASDAFSSDLTLADVRKCSDCLLSFNGSKLDAAMPGMASNTWVKDIVKIEVK